MSQLSQHEAFMRRAIEIAERGRWRTAPNPTVGAVLVRDGEIVAEGWHQVCGQAHAEVNCLRDAAEKGVDPAACTLYVTLEPCNHFGKTPPCSHAVLNAGIKRVFIGLPDMNAKAAGGAEFLRQNGVEVVSGLLEEECRELVADFITWQTSKRPYVILKMASTLDGRISTKAGRSQKVSNDASHAEVHRLREMMGIARGAVLVGGNTLALDDPRLTARTPTAQRQPLAAVITSRLPSESSSALVRERAAESVFFTSAAQAASPAAQALRAKGARVYGIDRAEKGLAETPLDMAQVLEILRNEENCLYVFCEGGGRTALSLLNAGLVDEFHLHMAPLILGDDEATPLFSGRHAESMEDALRMKAVAVSLADGDVHIRFRAKRG